MLNRMISQMDNQIGGLQVLQVKLPLEGEGHHAHGSFQVKSQRAPLIYRSPIALGMEKLSGSYSGVLL